MPKHIQLHELIAEEEAEICRLATSRPAAVRLVQRAKIIAALAKDPQLKAPGAGLRTGCSSL